MNDGRFLKMYYRYLKNILALFQEESTKGVGLSIIEKYPNTYEGYDVWRNYVTSFGLGKVYENMPNQDFFGNLRPFPIGSNP
ncbi:hypothetical protein N9Y26_00595 [bacterium]|nr:hypothetical protein [bacterium]